MWLPPGALLASWRVLLCLQGLSTGKCITPSRPAPTGPEFPIAFSTGGGVFSFLTAICQVLWF